MSWPPAFIPAGVFMGWSVILYYLSTRPVIEVRESGFRIGSEMFYWRHVGRLDSTLWNSPLMLHITLRNGRKVRLLYPGNMEPCRRLLRQMKRMARDAVIDGLPYREYWGETAPARVDHEKLTAPQPRVVRPEDEQEIERLFQQLKTGRKLGFEDFGGRSPRLIDPRRWYRSHRLSREIPLDGTREIRRATKTNRRTPLHRTRETPKRTSQILRRI